jgi:hypothetical protein
MFMAEACGESQPAAPFTFHTELRLVALTGLRATTAEELLLHLKEVPGSSIFYHTHHMYLAHHFERPTFTNDFALWASEALQNDSLGEQLAAVDLLAHTSVRSVRDSVVAIVESHLRQSPENRRCPPGDEFYFCRSKSFVMTTGLTAHNPDEFFAVLPAISNASLFYHFFESRLRLERTTNDFSCWLSAIGEHVLAAAIDRLDPYAVTLDELKGQIAALKDAQKA